MSRFLADDLFLIAHDVRSGKVRLPKAALGIGLSGALLSELLLAGNLKVSGGNLVVGDRSATAEPLTLAVLAELEQEIWSRQVALPDGLATYCRNAYDLVADRLISSGRVRPGSTRWPGRAAPRFLPMEPGEVFMYGQRLSAFVRNGLELGQSEVALVRLVLALPGGPSLLELGQRDRAMVETQSQQLPPGVRALLEAVDGAALPYQAAQTGPP